MKLSLKLQGDEHERKPILRAKIPLTIFNLPFISALSTTTTTTTTTTAAAAAAAAAAANAGATSKTQTSSSDLSFSLSTHFHSGPSLKLSYAPSSTPFSLSLKSGLGLLGSPHNSPLIFSACFSLSPTNPATLIPSFSLQFKPCFGHFSLHKTYSSNPDFDSQSASPATLFSGSSSNPESANGFVPDVPLGWQELKLEPFTSRDTGFANSNPNFTNEVRSDSGIGSFTERSLVWENTKKSGFNSGISAMARTVLPVTKRVIINLRWGVNGSVDSFSKMPYLTLNKIGLERVESAKKVEKKENNHGKDMGDMDLVKGMCSLLRRDLDVLEEENIAMKQCLEEIRAGVSSMNLVKRKESTSVNGKSFEFDRWKGNRSVGGEKGLRELKKPTNHVSSIESELQKAIKASS